MTTSTHTSAAAGRIAWVTGPLAVVLVAAGIAVGYLVSMEPVLSLVMHFAALLAAVATALCAAGRGLRLAGWALVPVCWVLSFYDWFGYGWEGSWWAWPDYVVDPIFYALMAMPAALLMAAVWRGPGSLLAEAAALVLLATSLWVLTISIGTATDPASPAGWLALVFAAAAVLVGVAAWRRPARRVAYGFLALLLALIAAGGPWLFHTEDPDAAPVGYLGVETFVPAVVAAAAVAAGLQFTWTALRKSRTAD
ncbi:hypothetical protein [Glycomyces terrestris]|uniref:Uncharacterized protein n=1 Tax=Glycomyces terrestris TaxID=2493553 RepID=A0A426UUW0_9ACTN|nr:hypothetical protein [Glycomyces terrestris]RRR98126.1 hypothetical protein EIW28_14490 [Glycomyces terrestris]